MAIMFPLFFVLLFVAEPRPFEVHTIFGRVLGWERSLDSPAAAFPSYHVVWAILALAIYEDRAPSWRWVWRSWTAAIIMSCLTTFAGADSEAILFGIAMGALILSGLWAQLLEGSSALLRPFGYFAGFVGVGLGLTAFGRTGPASKPHLTGSVWLPALAFSLFAGLP